MPQGAEGKDRRTTNLGILHRTHRIQFNIPMRRAFRRTHPVQTPLTRQATVHTERMTLQLKQPIRTIKGLWP